MADAIAGAIFMQMAVWAAVIAVIAFLLVRVMRAGGNAATAVKTMADPVEGVFLVTASAMPSRNSLYHMTRITGVISGEGLEPSAAQFSGLIKTSNWPSPGSNLPVIIDRADPTKFAIQWDKVGASGDRALDNAEALAAAMRARQDEPPA
jgi:hypothetical protein